MAQKGLFGNDDDDDNNFLFHFGVLPALPQFLISSSTWQN
jgi:hypothetical protein